MSVPFHHLVTTSSSLFFLLRRRFFLPDLMSLPGILLLLLPSSTRTKLHSSLHPEMKIGLLLPEIDVESVKIAAAAEARFSFQVSGSPPTHLLHTHTRERYKKPTFPWLEFLKWITQRREFRSPKFVLFLLLLLSWRSLLAPFSG